MYNFFRLLWEPGKAIKKKRKYLLLSFYSFTKAEETFWISPAQGSLKMCHFDVKVADKVSLRIAHRFQDIPKENKQKQMKMLEFSSGF